MTIYDEIADVFMASLAGQMSGVSREQFLAMIRAKWPTEDEARKHFALLTRYAETVIGDAAKDAAKRGAEIAIGYKIGPLQ